MLCALLRPLKWCPKNATAASAAAVAMFVLLSQMSQFCCYFYGATVAIIATVLTDSGVATIMSAIVLRLCCGAGSIMQRG